MRFRLRGFNNTNKAVQLCNSLFRRCMDRLGRNRKKLYNEHDGPSIAVINDYSPSNFGWFFNRPDKPSLHQCTTASNRQCNCTGECPDLDDNYAEFGATEGGVYRDPTEAKDRKRSKYEQLRRDAIAARIRAKRRREGRGRRVST